MRRTRRLEFIAGIDRRRNRLCKPEFVFTLVSKMLSLFGDPMAIGGVPVGHVDAPSRTSLSQGRLWDAAYVTVFTASRMISPPSPGAARLCERSFLPLVLVHFVQRAACHGQPIDQASLHLRSGAADESRCTAHADTDRAESEDLRSVQQCQPFFVGTMLFKMRVSETKVLIFLGLKRETFLVVSIKNAFSLIFERERWVAHSPDGAGE